ncbi:MAG: fasciclin domain-containing protein [Gammaproteobacteria bacterium]|nr:fasciclin domain-containing protein [Gammaproteobacteria bacterium]
MRFTFITLVAAFSLAATPLAFAGAHNAKKDIVDTAVAAGSFNTLAAALTAADLVGALKGAGPFTVFAPTDDAFAKLPAGTLDSLLKPENKEKLKGILLYHVVSGKIMAADIQGAASPATLQGATIDVKAAGGGVTVNGAKVTGADVGASNGVIHVIDAVILPPG